MHQRRHIGCVEIRNLIGNIKKLFLRGKHEKAQVVDCPTITASHHPKTHFCKQAKSVHFSAQRRLPYSLTFQRNTSEPVRYAASIEQMWYRLRAVRRCPVYVLRYGVSGLEILNLCEKCIAWEFEQTTVFNQMRVCLKCAVCSAATLTQKYDFYRGLARSRVWDLVSRGLVFW